MSNLLNELLSIEHAGWQSLCDGTAAEFYHRTMSDSGQMILADGSLLNRDQITTLLKSAPPWDSYEICHAQLISLTEQAAVIVYTGIAQRNDGSNFTARMSSTSTLIHRRVATKPIHPNTHSNRTNSPLRKASTLSPLDKSRQTIRT